jgi:uncharacterized protein (DUF302 family)/glutaredoxin
MANENLLTLYQREGCPYCQVVRKKLNQLGLRVLLVPVEQNGEDRRELKQVSGQQSVPVLVDKDNVIVESTEIMQYLDRRYGNGQSGAMKSNDYGLRVLVKGDFEQVVEKTIAALKTEGFGVLTEIDVKKTLKQKIGVDVPQQLILGACNPTLAHQAMQAEADLGLLLPCNVVVREAENGSYWVSAVDPLKLLSVVGRDDLLSIAAAVKSKMATVIETVSR